MCATPRVLARLLLWTKLRWRCRRRPNISGGFASLCHRFTATVVRTDLDLVGLVRCSGQRRSRHSRRHQLRALVQPQQSNSIKYKQHSSPHIKIIIVRTIQSRINTQAIRGRSITFPIQKDKTVQSNHQVQGRLCHAPSARACHVKTYAYPISKMRAQP